MKSFVVGLYCLMIGFLLGILADKVLYDRQRQQVLSQYEQAVVDLQQRRMVLEPRP